MRNRYPSRRRNSRFAPAALALFLTAVPCIGQVPTENLGKSDRNRITRSQFQVTEGEIEERPAGLLSVTSPKMRAVVPASSLPVAEIRFKYLGPTTRDVPLGSGEMRRQLGLKLRAVDPCNLIYVMWRLEPKAAIVVSTKLNPRQHTSSECENGGYQDIKPVHASPIHELEAGAFHSLRAEMKGEHLTVIADKRIVWEGALGGSAVDLEGPVGIRTDNGRFDFEFFTGALKPR
jgi:hypothetical protein